MSALRPVDVLLLTIHTWTEMVLGVETDLTKSVRLGPVALAFNFTAISGNGRRVFEKFYAASDKVQYQVEYWIN